MNEHERIDRVIAKTDRRNAERLANARLLLLVAAPSPYLTQDKAADWRAARKAFLSPASSPEPIAADWLASRNVERDGVARLLRALPTVVDLLAKLDELLRVREEEAHEALQVGGLLPMDDDDDAEIPIRFLRESRRLLEQLRQDDGETSSSFERAWSLAGELARLLKTAEPRGSLSALHAAKWRRERDKLLGLGEPEVGR